MPRPNRVVRNAIEAAYGIGAVEEIERYNDRKVDSLDDWGMDLPHEEIIAQATALRSIIADSPLPESGTLPERGQQRRPLLLMHPKWKADRGS